MGSLWTHNICDNCWESRHPGRLAIRIGVEYREQKFCCFCALLNSDGIFIREDPRSVSLNRDHESIHALNERDEDEPA